MTNPTSNYGWQMPTNTDLVTDLPADFEVFGQAVDTSLADLKGGTTGQILSKATNADMDFTWIANDQGDITAVNVTSPITGGGTAGAVTVGIQSASTSQSGAVQLSDSTSTTSSVLAATSTAVKSAYDLAAAANPKSTFAAKGSIAAATAASTPANLAVGSDFAFLQANSAQSTGLAWNNAAWITYTPTLSAQTGTYTSATVTGRYIRVGKLCIVQNQVVITTNGTAATQTVVTAPFAAASAGVLYHGCGRENAVTGTMLQTRIGSGASSFFIADYTGAYYGANGRQFDLVIAYEVA